MPAVEFEAARRRQLYYTTIYAQVFSPCRKYLAVGSSLGEIYLFHISNLLEAAKNDEATDEMIRPIVTFQAHNGPIYSMTSDDTHLISAGTGDINSWRWEDIQKKYVKLCWSLPVSQRDSMMKPETNAIAISTDENRSLFAGGGDNNVTIYDLENGKVKSVLLGHCDYIHCLSTTSDNKLCASGSDDGVVYIWDVKRLGKPVHKIVPAEHEDCVRPGVGSWIGCLDISSSNDWLVCGGGPKLSTWHMRTLSMCASFDHGSHAQNYVQFYNDEILSGGEGGHMYRWSFGSEQIAKLVTSTKSIFSLAVGLCGSSQLMATAGVGPRIDIYSNLMFRDHKLTLV